MTYYVKLTDGRLIYAPKKIKDGDTITYNPTAEMLLPLGYKPLTIMPMPEVEEGYHLEPTYAETDTEVVQDWTVVEDPPVEPDAEDILNILLGGDTE